LCEHLDIDSHREALGVHEDAVAVKDDQLDPWAHEVNDISAGRNWGRIALQEDSMTTSTGTLRMHRLHRGRPWDAKQYTRVMHRTTVAGKGPTA
jgi:hypothetical protein